MLDNMKNEPSVSQNQGRIHDKIDTFASENVRHFDDEFDNDSSNQIHFDSLGTGKVHTSASLSRLTFGFFMSFELTDTSKQVPKLRRNLSERSQWCLHLL